MAEQLLETTWRTALWMQFGAAIDVFENALRACPDALWRERLWSVPSDDPMPPEFSEFWYLGYHTLFWLDLYLSGRPEEEFTPPAPFIWTEVEPAVSPARPYTKEELLVYLEAMRHKCHTTLSALTDERARQIVSYPWADGKAVNYLELLLYNMRHVQDHAAQLHLFLGQHDIPDIASSVTRAKGGRGN